MSATRVLGVILVLAAPGIVQAQGGSPVTVGYTVPESPAFTFLGISPTKVSRASNARDLGAALLNSVDSTGSLLTGVALAATVWTLLPDMKIGLKKYQTSWKAYALANTQLSLGTVRASGDTGDTDIAIGLRTTLVDRSDPMQDSVFAEQLKESLHKCLMGEAQPPGGPGEVRDTTVPEDAADEDQPPIAPEDVGDTPVRKDADDSGAPVQCGQAAYDTLFSNWNREHWNKPALSWGAGMGWRVPGSRFGSMNHLGLSTWLVGSFPVGAGSQVIGQLQYDHRARRETLAETDVLTFGGRMTRGAASRNLFLEVIGTQRLNTVPGISRSNVQWSGGVEFQIAPDYWLSTGFGKRYSEQGEPDRMVVIANLRWGITSKSRLRIVPQLSPPESASPPAPVLPR